MLKSSYVPAKGEPIGDAIAKVWFGGQGIIGAIIIGLVVGAIYTVFIQRHIVIKMPEQVPQAIAKQFEAMIPAFVIFLLSMIVYIVSKVVTSGGTFIEMIYDVIQVPLQGLTGSLLRSDWNCLLYFVLVVVWCARTISCQWCSNSLATF